MYKIKPITINGNKAPIEFKSCSIDEITVITGGYIITPRGEIIVIDEKEEHCNIFSDYINAYLEQDSRKIYDTLTSTKMLCNFGCCVYSGIRYKEYIMDLSGNTPQDLCSLTFPDNMLELTEVQKMICKKLIASNKSILGNREKIYIQYGNFPDNIYTKDQIIEILNQKISQRRY